LSIYTTIDLYKLSAIIRDIRRFVMREQLSLSLQSADALRFRELALKHGRRLNDEFLWMLTTAETLDKQIDDLINGHPSGKPIGILKETGGLIEINK
jgi:hypothetical protein